ncbi:MAG: transporter [Haloarculaceae archaeon]
MPAVDAVIYAIHVSFAALWTGAVLFVTAGVLPTALDGQINATPMKTVTGRLKLVSRASALLLLITGGHLAATRYGGGELTGTTKGYLVIAMVVLWFLLAGLVEVGASKLSDGFDQNKVRSPAHEARPFLLAASAVAVLLLVDAGLILGL